MFRNLVLFAFLFHFVFKSNAECTSKECGIHRDVRTVRFYDKVGKLYNLLYNKLKKAINIKVDQLMTETKKRLNKNEVGEFLDEILIKMKDSDSLENSLRQGSTKYNLQPAPGFLPEMIFEDKNAEQLIAAHGYLSESHTVLTEDGYMLTMHRVVQEFDRINGRVVLLHHGLLGSSDDWLLLGRDRALPYMLVENGFDVWLLNARGNRYSRMHTNKTCDKAPFWDFSWHEIGIYDLPAEIKYVSEITNSSELSFIGHSMGCTALLVLLSTDPQYNTILSSAILLAPLVFMVHVKGPLSMLANFYGENGEPALKFFEEFEFMRNEGFPKQIVDKYCKGVSKSCYNTLLLVGNGGGSFKWDEKVLAGVLAHVPAGGSVKTVMHYVQLVKSGYFQKYDYGVDNNEIKYGNYLPPSYNLFGITLPITILTSSSDWLATSSDIKILLRALKNVKIHHVIKTEHFGHFEFLWSPHAQDLVYNLVVPILHQHLPKRYNNTWI